MYNISNTRKVFKFGENTTAVSLPKEFNIKAGSYLAFEKIDENSFKIVKVDIIVEPSKEIN